MGAAVISSNTSLKVSRAISGATTVGVNCYAVVTYAAGGDTHSGASLSTTFGSPQGSVINRYFGDGQSIPSTFTTTIFAYLPGGAGTPNSPVNVTWSLLSGVEFVNSP